MKGDGVREMNRSRYHIRVFILLIISTLVWRVLHGLVSAFNFTLFPEPSSYVMNIRGASRSYENALVPSR